MMVMQLCKDADRSNKVDMNTVSLTEDSGNDKLGQRKNDYHTKQDMG